MIEIEFDDYMNGSNTVINGLNWVAIIDTNNNITFSLVLYLIKVLYHMLLIQAKTSRKMNATYRIYGDIITRFGINHIYEITFYILSGCKYISVMY